MVYDNEGVRDLIVNALSRLGHHCIAAIDGNDALDKAGKNSLEAVITDIAMPGMDGITLTKELSKQCGATPIMILTGHADQYPPETAIAAGAREFVRKPFSIDEFVIRFHKMMRDHEMLCTLEAKKNEMIFNVNREFTEKLEQIEREVGRLKMTLTSKYASF